MAYAITYATTDTFNSVVLEQQQPVLVDFYADWCGPCKTIAPAIEAVADSFADRLRVAKVNVDDNPELATRYGVRGIPTLVVFKNGEPVDSVTGAIGQRGIDELVTPHL